MSGGNVTIVILLNVAGELVKTFPVIAHSLIDGIAVMSLRPNLDLIKPRAVWTDVITLPVED